MKKFAPICRPVLIGSLPLKDHDEAVELILQSTPDFPLWPQLPQNPKEGMVRQFLDGMPGLMDDGNKYWIDAAAEDIEMQMAAFYEDYMQACEDDEFLKDSRFAVGTGTAAGFSALTSHVRGLSVKPAALKGQVTGPVTTGIGTNDQNGRNIFFDDALRDIMVKLLAMKAKWQVQRLAEAGCNRPPIIFIDEPGIVSFGSSAYIAITREMVTETLQEIIDAIHQAGGLAGIHICANGDFSLALESETDIISFDAYSYFDNVVLYRPQLMHFIQRGGMLAWGIVPTSDPEVVETESTQSLMTKWEGQFRTLTEFGIDGAALMAQTFIAPACGTGSLSLPLARKVLTLTRELSETLRKRTGELSI